MKSTLFDRCQIQNLPREVLLRRMWAVIREQLTEKERLTLTAYYMEKKTLREIGREQNVNASTVLRNLRRAERKVRKFLRY